MHVNVYPAVGKDPQEVCMVGRERSGGVNINVDDSLLHVYVSDIKEALAVQLRDELLRLLPLDGRQDDAPLCAKIKSLRALLTDIETIAR